MEKAELERQLGVRGGVIRVGVLKNDTPLEVFQGIADYGFHIILVMQSGLDLLTIDRDKLVAILKASDSNLKKREELFEKYALQDDYEVISLLLNHKILTPAEIRRKTEWAADKGLFKIMPLLLNYADKQRKETDSDKILHRLKSELSGNKKGCIKHFKENAEEFDYDRELITLAVQKDGALLLYASPLLRADKEIVMTALAADKREEKPVLSYVSRKLYNDPEVVECALKNNPASITCLPKEKQEDPAVVKRALELSGEAYQYLLPNFREEKDLALLALSSAPEMYRFIPDGPLKTDTDVGIAAVTASVDVLAGSAFREAFSENADVMLAAIKADVRSMRYLSNAFKQDVEFAKKVLKIDKMLLSGFFYNVQSNEEIARLMEE